MTMEPSHKARVLDMGVISTLKELGGEDEPDLFVELIDLFLENAGSNFRALREALNRSDAQAIERTAHTLKSSCGNVGAMGLSEACFKLEQLGRAGRLDGVAEILADALREFDEVCLALNSEKS
jgi:HPt (histidine-containing phosphotransfer) domain-containing protein